MRDGDEGKKEKVQGDNAFCCTISKKERGGLENTLIQKQQMMT